MQGGQARHIRIGASTIVLREHLPELFRDVRKKFPGLKLSLREGYPAQFEEWLQKDEIDLAVTLIEKKAAPESNRWRCWNCRWFCSSKKQRPPVGGGIAAARQD